MYIAIPILKLRHHFTSGGLCASEVDHTLIHYDVTFTKEVAAICGRADNVLSMIILDNTDAADLIPDAAQGRFLLKGGAMFQAYWFDDAAGIASPHP